jgi:hypothetical protein
MSRAADDMLRPTCIAVLALAATIGVLAVFLDGCAASEMLAAAEDVAATPDDEGEDGPGGGHPGEDEVGEHDTDDPYVPITPIGPSAGRQDLMRFAFTGPLITGDLLSPPIVTFTGIRAFNDAVFVPSGEFASAYDDIFLREAEILLLDGGTKAVLRVEFDLSGRRMEAYAYAPAEPAHDGAVVIIPGSGHNQSTAIYTDDATNYHRGILGAFNADYDTYVFIKPNEDILAAHDGRRKLGHTVVVSYHLNRGGSYSASYIVRSLAITKYLRERYATVAVAGLSQGGAAALLNSLQSEPDLALVFSGYSVLSEEVDWAGLDQIMIPGVWSDFLEPDVLAARLISMQTETFFSWGTLEQGTYGIEAEEGLTCARLEVSGVSLECVRFDGGHEVPLEAVRAFLGQPRGGE